MVDLTDPDVTLDVIDGDGISETAQPVFTGTAGTVLAGGTGAEATATDLSTIYIAAAGGGVWKTTNKGTLWAPIFDATGENSFGDLAISPVDSRIVWAGTGE